MDEANITNDEVKEVVTSLKSNKSPWIKNISANVVNETSNMFFLPLNYIFNLSLLQEIFPENLQIAEISPI